MGIALDLLVLLTLAAAIARGWKRGFLFQAAQLSMLVVVYFLARAIASTFDRSLASAFDVSPVVAGAVSLLASFVILGLIGTVIITIILRELTPSGGALTQLNRVAGTALGAAKGGLFCYVLIASLIQVGRASEFEIPWRSSLAGKLVSDHNVLDRGEVGAFAKLAYLTSRHDLPTLMADPRFGPISSSPHFEVFTSMEVLAALGQNDYVALVTHEPLWEFFRDPAVQGALATFSWRE